MTTGPSIALPGLADKLIVITGAAGGQGLAEALLLADSGARVIATDIADQTPDALSGAAGRIEYRRLDVGSAEEWAALAAELGRRGELHGLVNNAGITFRARLDDIALEDWNRVLGVNLTGAMLGMQALAPLMRSGASIVNIGSAAALTPHYPVAYTASKWGLRGLSGAAATEYGPRGIRVNLVHPGFIETPMTASAPAAMVEAQLALTPLERTGTSDEVAAVVAFLLSDLAAYVTGAEIPVDGGYTSSRGVKFMSDSIARSGTPASTT